MAPVQAALPGSPPTRPSPAGSWSLDAAAPGVAERRAGPGDALSADGADAQWRPPAPLRWPRRRQRDAMAPQTAPTRNSPSGSWSAMAAPRVQRHAVSIKHDGAAAPDARVAVELWTAAPPASRPRARRPAQSALAAAPNGTLEKVTVLQAQGSGILVKGKNDAQRVVPSVTELTKTPPTQGSKAYYEMMGKIEQCTVTTVHTDAAEPYYTVTLSNGSTRTTEAAHVLVPSSPLDRRRQASADPFAELTGGGVSANSNGKTAPVPTERPRPLQAAQGLRTLPPEKATVLKVHWDAGDPPYYSIQLDSDRCGKADGRTTVGESLFLTIMRAPRAAADAGLAPSATAGHGLPAGLCPAAAGLSTAAVCTATTWLCSSSRVILSSSRAIRSSRSTEARPLASAASRGFPATATGLPAAATGLSPTATTGLPTTTAGVSTRVRRRRRCRCNNNNRRAASRAASRGRAGSELGRRFRLKIVSKSSPCLGRPGVASVDVQIAGRALPARLVVHFQTQAQAQAIYVGGPGGCVSANFSSVFMALALTF